MAESASSEVRAIDPERIRRELRKLDSTWPQICYVSRTGSTNADAVAAARGGAPAWTIFVTDCQTAGRGRIGRSWQAPCGSSLLASVILRPSAQIAAEALGWVPLMAGMAIVRAVREGGVAASLKWPNDVIVVGADGVGWRKLAGVLVERVGPALVVGLGVNATMAKAELPAPTATSLELEGSSVLDRCDLLVATMTELSAIWGTWTGASGDADRAGVREGYRGMSATLGHLVEVDLPGDGRICGVARDVDAAGHLVIDVDGLTRVVTAGDVIRVRPGPA